MINGAAFPLVSTATGNRIAHRNSAARPSEHQGRRQRGRARERKKRNEAVVQSVYGRGMGVPVPGEKENRDFHENVG